MPPLPGGLSFGHGLSQGPVVPSEKQSGRAHPTYPHVVGGRQEMVGGKGLSENANVRVTILSL